MVSSSQTKLLSAKPTCMLLFAAWIYAFWPTIHTTVLAYAKSSFDYQGLLVLPLILFGISKCSKNLNRAPLLYNQYGLVLLLGSTLVWLFATIAALYLLAQIAIISILLSIIFTTCGKKVTNIILLPLLCLFLLLPIGSDISKAISQWFAISIVKALSVSNISVYWENQKIYANNNPYDIQAYLGNFKYVMLFITMGCSFALLRTKNIIIFSVIASSFVIMPLITLWLTLYSFVFFNNIWDPITLSQHSIIIIGWTCTIIGILHAIALSIFIGKNLNLLHTSEDIDWHSYNVKTRASWIFPLIMASTIILIAPVVAKQLDNSKHYGSIDNLILHHDATVTYSFTHAVIQNDATWKQVKQNYKKLKINGKNIKVQETVLRNKNKQFKIVWRINYINGHLTHSPALAKALSKIYTLTPKGSRAGVITMSTQVKNDLSHGRNILKEYINNMYNQNQLLWLK